jgi:hypothetical protein
MGHLPEVGAEFAHHPDNATPSFVCLSCHDTGGPPSDGRDKGMAEVGNAPDVKEGPQQTAPTGWGRWLFWGTFAVLLVFFWWLLIFSHGVEVHHG